MRAAGTQKMRNVTHTTWDGTHMLALCQPHLSEREKRKVAKRQGRDRRRGRQLVCEREKRYERVKRSKVTPGKRRQTVNGGGVGRSWNKQ